jgi:hypothetical protein
VTSETPIEEIALPKRRIFHDMPGYNPRLHAPVLAMGGKFIEEGEWQGKFRLNGHLCDAWGHLLDPSACPVCQGMSKLLLFPNPNPWAKPWEQAFTICPRCVKG